MNPFTTAKQVINRKGGIMKITALIAGVLLFASCSSSSEKDTDNESGTAQVIRINPKNNDNEALSKLVEQVEYIPLETKEESLIGDVSKIVVANGKIFIKDDNVEEIKIFGLNGRYLGKISQQHRGPGGYLRINEFSVLDDGSAVDIYDNRNFKILRYSSSNTFLGETKVKYLITDFISVSKTDKIVYAGFGPSYQMEGFPAQHRLLFSSGSKVVKKAFPYQYNDDMTNIVGSFYNFYRHGDTVGFAAEKLSNEVYHIVGEKIELKYKVDFGKYNRPVTYKSSREEIKRFMGVSRSSNYAKISGVLENDKYLYVCYSFRGIFSFFLYNKEIKKSYVMPVYYIDTENKLCLPFPEAVYENKFVGVIDGYNMHTFLNDLKKSKYSTPTIKKLEKEITALSNPVVVFIKFK